MYMSRINSTSGVHLLNIYLATKDNICYVTVYEKLCYAHEAGLTAPLGCTWFQHFLVNLMLYHESRINSTNRVHLRVLSLKCAPGQDLQHL